MPPMVTSSCHYQLVFVVPVYTGKSANEIAGVPADAASLAHGCGIVDSYLHA